MCELTSKFRKELARVGKYQNGNATLKEFTSAVDLG